MRAGTGKKRGPYKKRAKASGNSESAPIVAIATGDLLNYAEPPKYDMAPFSHRFSPRVQVAADGSGASFVPYLERPASWQGYDIGITDIALSGAIGTLHEVERVNGEVVIKVNGKEEGRFDCWHLNELFPSSYRLPVNIELKANDTLELQASASCEVVVRGVKRKAPSEVAQA